MVPIAVGLRFPNLDIIKPDTTEKINDTIIYGSWTCAILDALPPKPDGGGLWIKIGRAWYITINAVRPTIILIIFAESMVLFLSSLKSINGKGAFFSVLTNRTRKITDTLENKIQEKQEIQKWQAQLRIKISISQLYRDVLMMRNSNAIYTNILIDNKKYVRLEPI